MSRARLLKPSFFTNEKLAELPFETRLLFAGLWTIADREGRLEDRPRRIHAELFPYDPHLNLDAMLTDLAEAGFIYRYTIDDQHLIWVPGFTRHQQPHHRESESKLSPYPGKAQPQASPGPGPTLARPSPSDPVSGDPVSDPDPVAVAVSELVRPPIFKLYSDTIGALGPTQAQLCKEIEADYPWPCIDFAFREAAAANVRRLDYVKAILENHKRGGQCTDDWCAQPERPGKRAANGPAPREPASEPVVPVRGYLRFEDKIEYPDDDVVDGGGAGKGEEGSD